MDILKRGESAKVTFCDKCGSQLLYKKEDIYSDIIVETQNNTAYRYSVKFLMCPVCKNRILLDKTIAL